MFPRLWVGDGDEEYHRGNITCKKRAVLGSNRSFNYRLIEGKPHES